MEKNLVETLDMIFGQQNVFIVDEKTDLSENSPLTKKAKLLLKETHGKELDGKDKTSRKTI